jgi:ABC-type multidrug transport system fused ATPase/permease subunit
MNIIDQQNEQEILKGKLKPEMTGNVTFEDVSFTYPQRKESSILNHVSFKVKKNQKIALVGASGAGKSTITSLLLNYYTIDSGRILFDDTSISDIDVNYLRSKMAIVPQEVILFAGTIKENIAFGKLKATEEEIILAAKKANAWEFIDSFQEKLETQVGDRGIQLSGGQKQRIAIARAILKDPAILILDEATSALDSESEKLVQEAIELLMVGRTSFVVAHRLSTIKNADVIFVVENGEIKETGTHDELISLKGKYAKLVKLQGVERQIH